MNEPNVIIDMTALRLKEKCDATYKMMQRILKQRMPNMVIERTIHLVISKHQLWGIIAEGWIREADNEFVSIKFLLYDEKYLQSLKAACEEVSLRIGLPVYISVV